MTRHRAFGAHNPGQGLTHLLFKQDRLFGQSELARHSGRQAGGEPRKPAKQEQIGLPASPTLQLLLGPHGVGQHGVVGREGLLVELAEENCAKRQQI